MRRGPGQDRTPDNQPDLDADRAAAALGTLSALSILGVMRNHSALLDINKSYRCVPVKNRSYRYRYFSILDKML
jgi:hypothetical protein